MVHHRIQTSASVLATKASCSGEISTRSLRLSDLESTDTLQMCATSLLTVEKQPVNLLLNQTASRHQETSTSTSTVS